MLNLPRVLAAVLAGPAGTVAMLGCNGTGDVPRTDTTASAPPPIPSAGLPTAPDASGWGADAGPVLLVAGSRPDAAIVVFPEIQGDHAAADLQFDTTALRGVTAILVGRAGTTSSAVLGERAGLAEDEECVGWPMRRIITPTALAGSSTPWTIGLVGARLTPLVLDSVGSLSPTDSAALVAEVTRLASTVPVRTDAARLRGLPFSVQDVRHFKIAAETDAIVARVVRGVHQEANPLEERTLLIAERDSGQRQDPRASGYMLVFHQRAFGREETLEGSEILAALTLQNTLRPMLVIARESEGGVRYMILERTASRSWRVKWTSALVRC